MASPPSPPMASSTHSGPELHVIVTIFFVSVALAGFLTAAWCSDSLRCCDDLHEEKAPVLSSDAPPVDDREPETEVSEQENTVLPNAQSPDSQL